MLDKNKFVVNSQKKMLSSKKTFDILDGETGEKLATTGSKKGLLGSILGMFMGGSADNIQVRLDPSNKPVLSVRRKGLIFKKVLVLDGKGAVVGRYKAKKFSLSGGLHIYDKKGKHFAEAKGKLLKYEFKFVSPDGSEEIGSVSKKSKPSLKSLLSSGSSYGVEIADAYHDDHEAKILILGAAIALETMFGKSGGGSSEESSGGDDE